MDELAIEDAAKQAMNTLALTKNPVEYLADKIHVLSHWFKKSCSSIEFCDEICGVTNFEKWLRALVLLPTRELASQVALVARRLGSALNLFSLLYLASLPARL